MNTRTAKPLVMTTMAGDEITCAPAVRRVDPRRPSARRKYAEPVAAPQGMEGLYRIAELRYVDCPREAWSPADVVAAAARIQTSYAMDNTLRLLYGGRTVEFFGAVALSTRNHILGHAIVGQGNVATAPVSMSELARFLCLSGSAGFIVFHNHPSGSLEWSADDMEITRRIANVGHLLGIKLVDHLLITTEGYLSMLDRGLGDLLKPDAERSS